MKCYYKASKEQLVKGDERYSIKTEWMKARKIAIKRDKSVCKLCGASGVKTQIHHLDSGGRDNVSSNNHPDNLATLCLPCHKAIHNVQLVPKDGKWIVTGSIFNILGLETETIISLRAINR